MPASLLGYIGICFFALFFAAFVAFFHFFIYDISKSELPRRIHLYFTLASRTVRNVAGNSLFICLFGLGIAKQSMLIWGLIWLLACVFIILILAFAIVLLINLELPWSHQYPIILAEAKTQH